LASTTRTLPHPPSAAAPAALDGAAGRWLLPSFSDCLFLAVLIWIYSSGSGGWKGLLADGDSGWHIRTGEYILDHHRVPYQDLYSFSRPGAPWYAWEWLSDVIFGSLHRLAGLKGVVLTAGVVIALFATTLIRRMIWRGVNLLIAMLDLFFKKTRTGKAMRACAINREAAALQGIPVSRMLALSFALSAALGAIAGVLITPTQYTAFNVGVPFAISGFIAAIVGGFGRPLGAFVGGIMLGLAQAVAIVVFGAGLKNVAALSVLLLFLFIRPGGILGEAK